MTPPPIVEQGRSENGAARGLIIAVETGSINTRWRWSLWLAALQRLPDSMRDEVRDRVWWELPETVRERLRRKS